MLFFNAIGKSHASRQRGKRNSPRGEEGQSFLQTLLSNRHYLAIAGGIAAAILLLSWLLGSLSLGFALVSGGLAIAYGAYSVQWILAQPKAPSGARRDSRQSARGISRSNRQYTTIAKVGAGLFLLIGIVLIWRKTAFGFLLVSARSRVRRVTLA